VETIAWRRYPWAASKPIAAYLVAEGIERVTPAIALITIDYSET
jgi:hypothetical protein